VDAESKLKLKANGMQVLEPSAQLKAEMKKVGDTMLTEWLEKSGADGQALLADYKR
jgi:TRAP-type C4-dicarboxylate transport system substrate-binding protein